MGYDDYKGILDWIGPALWQFFLVAVAAAALGTAIAALISIVRYGPSEAFYKVWEGIFRAVPDLMLSPRRVGAIARLAIQETLRRRVMLVAFGIFALALLFGGWFLDSSSDHPERTYLGFVLAGTQFLVLFMGLLISTFSLPQDIQNKTIYTVVTKPIRASEIVVGRIVGFLLVGSVLLTAMGLISLGFVIAGLSHDHRAEVTEFARIEPSSTDTPSGRRASDNAYYEAQTRRESGHRHRIELQLLDADRESLTSEGTGVRWVDLALRTQVESGHRHDVILDGIPADGKRLERDGLTYTLFRDGGLKIEVQEGLYDVVGLIDAWPLGELLQEAGATLETSGPVDILVARVPRYADELSFLDREGGVAREGVNVGKMSMKFSYIDGGSSMSRAIFRFIGLRGSDFPAERVPLDLSLRVFRTLKGDITRRVTGEIIFRNTKEVDGRQVVFTSDPIAFESQEYAIQTLPIERRQMVNWQDVEGNPQRVEMDLFDELAGETGTLEAVLRCNDPGQYFGVSPASVYFKMKDGSFALNFGKCYLGIWMQLALVTSLGVTLSTFLNASVSLLSTLSGLCVGFFGQFINELASKELEGGGPLEALYRLVTQMNLTGEIGDGGWLSSADEIVLQVMNATTNIVPDFTKFDSQVPLADGYDIPFGLLAIQMLVTLTFAAGCSVVGYFALRTREIAA